jgi:hypothetical protein
MAVLPQVVLVEVVVSVAVAVAVEPLTQMELVAVALVAKVQF